MEKYIERVGGWLLTNHDGSSFGVNCHILTRNNTATATLTKRLLVNLRERERDGERGGDQKSWKNMCIAS